MFDNFKVKNYPKVLFTPEMDGRHLSRLFSGDVIDGLTVVAKTGFTVTLQPGNAFIRYGSGASASSRLFSLLADFDITLDTADVSNPRKDLIVVYIDNAVDLPGGSPTTANLDGPGVVKAMFVKGTPAASPVAPNSTAIAAAVGASNQYFVVAEITVDKQPNTVIASNKIVDKRAIAKLGLPNLDLPAQSNIIAAGQPTSSTSYTNLATVGPAVTVDIPASGRALVTIASTMFGAQTYMGFAVSGATTIAANDAQCILIANLTSRIGATYLVTGLTPGSNTFTAKYRVNAGTGSFVDRCISVLAV